MAALAQIFAGLLSLVKPLFLFLVYLGGKRAATTELKAEQAQQDAALEKDYLDNRAKPRTDDDVIGRVQDGTF